MKLLPVFLLGFAGAFSALAVNNYITPSHQDRPIIRRKWRCDDSGMTRLKAQKLFSQGATYLDGDGDGKACEFLPTLKEPASSKG